DRAGRRPRKSHLVALFERVLELPRFERTEFERVAIVRSRYGAAVKLGQHTEALLAALELLVDRLFRQHAEAERTAEPGRIAPVLGGQAEHDEDYRRGQESRDNPGKELAARSRRSGVDLDFVHGPIHPAN